MTGTITVVNIKTAGRPDPTKPWEVYIGRRASNLAESALCNPFALNSHTRTDSLDNYKRYFAGHAKYPWADSIILELKRLLALLKKYGKLTLFCWCKPLACHGDIIKEYLEKETDNGR